MPGILPTIDDENCSDRNRIESDYSTYNRTIDHPDPYRRFPKSSSVKLVPPSTLTLAPESLETPTTPNLRNQFRFKYTPTSRLDHEATQTPCTRRTYPAPGGVYRINSKLGHESFPSLRKRIDSPEASATPNGGRIKLLKSRNEECKEELPSPLDLMKLIRNSERFEKSKRTQFTHMETSPYVDAKELVRRVHERIGKPGRYGFTPPPTTRTLQGVFNVEPVTKNVHRPSESCAPFGLDIN